MDTLKSFRSDETWDHTFRYITDVATLHNIELDQARPIRHRRRPQRMDEFVATSSVGHREILNSSQSLKLNVYFPVLDSIQGEMDHRFTSKNLGIMRSLQACNPLSKTFLEASQFNALTTLYNLDSDLLETECLLAKRTLSTQNDCSQLLTYIATSFH